MDLDVQVSPRPNRSHVIASCYSQDDNDQYNHHQYAYDESHDTLHAFVRKSPYKRNGHSPEETGWKAVFFIRVQTTAGRALFAMGCYPTAVAACERLDDGHLDAALDCCPL